VYAAQGLKARGNVEDWLGKVEESMFFSLRKLVRGAMTDYEQRSREDWVLLHASQVGDVNSRKTTSGSGFHFGYGCPCRNSLPSFVRDQQSLAAFRQQLKTVLYRTSFGEDANA